MSLEHFRELFSFSVSSFRTPNNLAGQNTSAIRRISQRWSLCLDGVCRMRFVCWGFEWDESTCSRVQENDIKNSHSIDSWSSTKSLYPHVVYFGDICLCFHSSQFYLSAYQLLIQLLINFRFIRECVCKKFSSSHI